MCTYKYARYVFYGSYMWIEIFLRFDNNLLYSAQSIILMG